MSKFNLSLARTDSFGKMLRIVAASALVLASLAPLLGVRNASAAQMTDRSVTISTSELGGTADYQFDFTVPTAAAIQGILFEFCTTPIGTCTAPGGTFDVSTATVDATQTFSEATLFTDDGSTDENDCLEVTDADNVFCAGRADTDAETAIAKQITLDGITNLSTEDTVYVRITTYSDTAFATPVDSGVVAMATVNQITTTGRVQENLEFCIAAIDDAAALPTDPADCIANFNDTTVDIGVIDNTGAAVSPVATTTTNGSDDDYGIATLSTNASSGASLVFFSEDAGSGTEQLSNFRVTGATCNASDATLTDQCFRPAANAGTNFDPSDGERFGIHIPCIDDTQGTTSALSGTAEYDNADGDTSSATNCHSFDGVGGGTPDTGDTFAWWDGSTADEIASSSGPVHDENVKIRFGAIASATTPTGSYTVTTTYVATPTF